MARAWRDAEPVALAAVGSADGKKGAAMRLSLTIAAALALGACAGGSSNTYATELAALQRDCAARNGMLTPLRGGTGRPATDYACEIRGGGSQIDR